MIELAVLGLLRENPRHGYELKQRCSEILGPLWGVSFGSLYPALRRLERAGAIEIVETDDEPGTTAMPLPATGSLSADLAAARRRRRPRPVRRNRKAYRITDAGVATLQRLLTDDDDAGDDRTFALKLAFCRYLNGDERLALLQARRAHLASRISRARRGDAGAHSLDRYTASLLEHRHKATEFELAWVDQLVDEERTALAVERNRTKGAMT